MTSLLNGDPKTDVRQFLLGFLPWSRAQCASVNINYTEPLTILTRRAARKKSDPICSVFCVMPRLSKGTDGELIEVDSTKGKHCRCSHKQRLFICLSLLTQTAHTKISAISNVLTFSRQFLTTNWSNHLRGNRAICFEHFIVFLHSLLNLTPAQETLSR